MHPIDAARRETEIMAVRLATLKPGLDQLDPKLFPLAEKAFWGDSAALREFAQLLTKLGRETLAKKALDLLGIQPWKENLTPGFNPHTN